MIPIENNPIGFHQIKLKRTSDKVVTLKPKNISHNPILRNKSPSQRFPIFANNPTPLDPTQNQHHQIFTHHHHLKNHTTTNHHTQRTQAFDLNNEHTLKTINIDLDEELPSTNNNNTKNLINVTTMHHTIQTKRFTHQTLQLPLEHQQNSKI